MMQVACAWCGRSMGEAMGPDGAISHGICAECGKREVAKFQASMVRRVRHDADPTTPTERRSRAWSGPFAEDHDGLD